MLDNAGLSAHQTTRYLGHERGSTARNVYLERGVAGELAGPILEERPAIALPKSMG